MNVILSRGMMKSNDEVTSHHRTLLYEKMYCMCIVVKQTVGF